MKKLSMKQPCLLLEDVVNLGKKGDLVHPKPGFLRNFLLPQRKGVLATPHTLRLRQRLQEERAQQSAVERRAAEEWKQKIQGKTFTLKVKVDGMGHLYGSVSTLDIVKFLAEEEGLQINRKQVLLGKPIKMVGVYDITLRLQDEVEAKCKLQILGDEQSAEVIAQIVAAEESPALSEGESDLEEVEGEGEPSS